MQAFHGVVAATHGHAVTTARDIFAGLATVGSREATADALGTVGRLVGDFECTADELEQLGAMLAAATPAGELAQDALEETYKDACDAEDLCRLSRDSMNSEQFSGLGLALFRRDRDLGARYSAALDRMRTAYERSLAALHAFVELLEDEIDARHLDAIPDDELEPDKLVPHDEVMRRVGLR